MAILNIKGDIMNKVNHEGVGERALYSREYKYRLMRYSGTT